VVPEFYARDAQGIPVAWVARMRESMACLTPRFSANRTVREYTERYYLPAAAAFRQRVADKGALAAQVLDWQRTLARHWGAVHFGDLHVETTEGQYLFQVPVYLDDLEPDAVRVELYADGRDGDAPVRQAMTRGEPLVGATHGYRYSARAPATRPAGDYTPRVIPHHPAAIVPLEAAQILWQR
jgi:starch phosphorylase